MVPRYGDTEADTFQHLRWFCPGGDRHAGRTRTGDLRLRRPHPPPAGGSFRIGQKHFELGNFPVTDPYLLKYEATIREIEEKREAEDK